MHKRAGFTIMEILISISILLVGIVGVISLFPVAINVGGEAVTDSLSANLARSVEEAIRASMKHRLVTYTRGGDRRFLLGYFIYDHDGIYSPKYEEITKDPVPADPRDVKRTGASLWGLDCVILLPCDTSPQASPDRGYTGASAADARRKAYLASKVFVYPEGDPEESKGAGAPANGAGDPRRADDDKDDYELDHSNEAVVKQMREKLLPGEEWPLRVTKTYRFGPKVLGLDTDRTLSPAQRRKLEDEDPYRLYSYAFSIRRAYEDGDLATHVRPYAPANDLFEFKVMIFRGFLPETRQAHPIYTTSFLASR